MEYLIILILIFASSLSLNLFYGIRAYDSVKEGIIITLFFLIIGTLWDHFAIYRGHWIFPGTGLLGIKIGLMPLEEYLFTMIIPFWIITTYKFVKKIFK